MEVLNALKSYHNRFFYLLAVVVFFLPFSEFITSLFLLFIGVNFFTHRFWKTPKSIWQQPWLLVMLLFFCMQIVGLYITPEAFKGIANKKIETKLPFVIVPIFLATGLHAMSKKQIHQLIQLFVLSVTAMALFCLAYASYNVYSTGSWHSTWGNGSLRYWYFLYSGLSEVLMHPGYMSVFVGLGIFCGFHWQQTATSKSLKTALPFLIGFLIVFLILLQGRINILSFLFVSALALAFNVVKNKSFTKIYAIIGAVLVLLGAAFVVVAPEGMKQRFTGLANFSYDLEAPTIHDFTGITIRFAEWECAREAIAQNGFWGTGQGAAQAALRQVYKDKNFVVGLDMDLNAHNQLYETRLANGVLGLLILLLLFAVWQWKGWLHKNYLLLMTSSFYFISFLSESMLERYFGVIVLCIILPIIARLHLDPCSLTKKST